MTARFLAADITRSSVVRGDGASGHGLILAPRSAGWRYPLGVPGRRLEPSRNGGTCKREPSRAEKRGPGDLDGRLVRAVESGVRLRYHAQPPGVAARPWLALAREITAPQFRDAQPPACAVAWLGACPQCQPPATPAAVRATRVTTSASRFFISSEVATIGVPTPSSFCRPTASSIWTTPAPQRRFALREAGGNPSGGRRGRGAVVTEALETRIAAYLREHPNASGGAVAKAVRGRRSNVLEIMRRFRAEGLPPKPETLAQRRTAAVSHGLYRRVLVPSELEDVDEILDELRTALPLYASSFEPALQTTAMRLWRLRSAYAYLASHGLEAKLASAFFRDLGVLERTVQRDFQVLGLTPAAALELGVNVQRLSAEDGRPYDVKKLSPEERAELERLIARMEEADIGG